MQGVTVVDHPLVQHKLTLMRAKERSTKGFRQLLNEIGMLLCYEVTRDLPMELVEVETPLSPMQAPQIAGKKLVFAPILRAGVGFLDGMLDLRALRARGPYRALPRPRRRCRRWNINFKAPSDLGRPPRDGARPDVSPRPTRRSRPSTGSSSAGRGTSLRLPARRAGGRRADAGGHPDVADLGPRPSTSG